MSGMALWKASIQKTYQNEAFENTYVLRTGSLPTAMALAQTISTYERAVHSQGVFFHGIYVRPAIFTPGGGTVVSLTGTGSRASTTHVLSLFNCVRCFFRPQSGKPSQKYLRIVLDEDMQNGGVLEAGTVTMLQNSYVTPLMSMPEFVDVGDQPFLTAGVYPRVQMRQLHWRRRGRATEKRGWVPK